RRQRVPPVPPGSFAVAGAAGRGPVGSLPQAPWRCREPPGGTGGGTRTLTMSPSADFESAASTVPPLRRGRELYGGRPRTALEPAVAGHGRGQREDRRQQDQLQAQHAAKAGLLRRGR